MLSPSWLSVASSSVHPGGIQVAAPPEAFVSC